jgi:hypothetical protein
MAQGGLTSVAASPRAAQKSLFIDGRPPTSSPADLPSGRPGAGEVWLIGHDFGVSRKRSAMCVLQHRPEYYAVLASGEKIRPAPVCGAPVWVDAGRPGGWFRRCDPWDQPPQFLMRHRRPCGRLRINETCTSHPSPRRSGKRVQRGRQKHWAFVAPLRLAFSRCGFGRTPRTRSVLLASDMPS